MKKLSLLFILLLVTSCAPMPGNTLVDGLTEPTAQEDIENYNIVIENIFSTSVYCNVQAIKEGNYGIPIFNCLLNSCLSVGCASLYWDDTGHIYECNIHIASGFSWLLLEHEKRHCLGYDDVLY